MKLFSLIKKWWWMLLLAAGLVIIIFFTLEAQQKVDAIEKELKKPTNHQSINKIKLLKQPEKKVLAYQCLIF